MSHITNLTRAEAEGIKLALAQLIDERNLEAAISLLEASIDLSGTENGEMRALMFKTLLTVAHS
jgi:hypothetical protein